MAEMNEEVASKLLEHISLGRLPGKFPVTSSSGASIRSVLELMDRHRVGSVVIMEATSKKPVGILTLQDVLRRVALPGVDLEQPVAVVMTPYVETLDESATVYESLLFMSHRRIRHVPVVNAAGELVSVVSLNQVRDPFAGEVDVLMSRIDEAADIDELIQLAGEARVLGGELLTRHGDSGMLTSVLSSLNDALSRRIIELVVARHRVLAAPWCWIVMGSEGRFEQTFHTDQDNGLIFSADSPQEADDLRRLFLPMAREINQYLDQCGIPHCTGGIMAGNAACCLSLDEWKERFYRWIRTPDQQALINATIFFDYRPLYGDDLLAKNLRDYLTSLSQGQDAFLRFMANNALAATPPIGIVRDFVTELDQEKRKTLDLKKFGARIFVDAARIFALSAGCPETNTVARLRAAGQATGIHVRDIDSSVQAFGQLQRIRLATQALSPGARDRNLLDPETLHRLDRKILRESLLQAQNLQSRLKLMYSL